MKNALAAASAVMLVVVGLVNAGAAPRSIPSMLPATTAADSAPFPHRLVADHAPGEADMARLQAMLSEYRGLPDRPSSKSWSVTWRAKRIPPGGLRFD